MTQKGNSIPTLHDRLSQIIERSFEIFCQQTVGGAIRIQNEASMQLLLANILMNIGRLYEFETDSHISVIPEYKINISHTQKSPKGNARVDLWIELRNSSSCAMAAIELKYLQKSTAYSNAITKQRYGVLKDMENLEKYPYFANTKPNPDLITREIIYTQNKNLVESSPKVAFSLGDAGKLSSHISHPSTNLPSIILNNTYPINWQRYEDSAGNNHFFLMLKSDKL